MARRTQRPQSTLVMLVRHGHTATTGKVLPGRARGLHLDAIGRAQAEAVAAALAKAPLGGRVTVQAVYASPLERTRETAAAVASALGLAVQTERGLIEADTGDWTGRELKDAARTPEWKVVQGHPSGFRFPGGESLLEMQVRVVAAVERLRDAHLGAALVAVSHADPIKAVVAHALGTHLDQFQRFVISPCSVTTLRWGPGGPPTVLAVNWVPETVAQAS